MAIDETRVDRFFRLTDTIADRELAGELNDLLGGIIAEKQQEAIEHQGEVILAAVRGELTAWPGCAPEWSDGPRRAAEMLA